MGLGLIQGGQSLGSAPFIGHKLSRDEPLAHPRLPDFWMKADVLPEQDPTIHQAIHYPEA